MFKATVAILCIAVANANATPIISAAISLSGKTTVAPLALNGITDCGVARLSDVRLTGCSNAPCQVSVGSQYTLEIDFSPRDMHWDMSHRAIIHKESQLVELSDGPLPDSTVHPGQMYTFTYQFTVPSTISGDSEFRVKVYQNYVHELCMVIPIRIG